MRFLIDTNLPRALSGWIVAKGHVCEHVLDVGLAQSKDKTIWSYADSNSAIVVSKDEDFADLSRQSASGPCVLWLHTGNGTTRALLRLLEPLWPAIEARIANGERLIEVR